MLRQCGPGEAAAEFERRGGAETCRVTVAEVKTCVEVRRVPNWSGENLSFGVTRFFGVHKEHRPDGREMKCAKFER